MWYGSCAVSPATECGQDTQHILPRPPLWPPLGIGVKAVKMLQIHSWHVVGWLLETPYSLWPIAARLEGEKEWISGACSLTLALMPHTQRFLRILESVQNSGWPVKQPPSWISKLFRPWRPEESVAYFNVFIVNSGRSLIVRHQYKSRSDFLLLISEISYLTVVKA